MNLAQMRDAGANLPGDCGSDPYKQPPWMDEVRFKRGRDFFCKHIWSIAYAWHVSLTAGFVLENLLHALIFTKMSDTPMKAKQRYSHTFAYLVLWHTEDVWKPDSSAFQSVQAVRRMHVGVANRISAKQGKTALSQYDMALVQSGFMGAVIMYPDLTGIACTKQELADYVFFWRGIGYLLGIDDQYNICSGTLDETLDLVRDIEKTYILPGMQAPPQDFHRMSRAYVEGTQLIQYFPGQTYRAIIYLAQTNMQSTIPVLMFPKLSIPEWFCVYVIRFLVFAVLWIPGFSTIMNHGVFRRHKKIKNEIGFKPKFGDKQF